MFSVVLDEHELGMLIVALKYWRSNRRETPRRRTDPDLSPHAMDLLLAKLETGTLASLPPDPDSTSLFHR